MVLLIYTQGIKKFRIQTLRVCRGDKMKLFCYVTNIWQVLRFLARGPWRVWRRMVLQKMLKSYEITLSLFVTYYRKCWRMSRYNSDNDYGSSMTGPQRTLPLMSENTWTMFSTIVGLGGVVHYSGHHVLPISLLWFLYLGGMKCLVYETPIDPPEELVARVAEAAAIIRETQSFARRYQLCINVNERHFQ